LTWEKHLEHWIVGLRTGWLDWFFIALSWIGSSGAVWLALAFAIAVARRRPAIFLTVLFADLAADLLAVAGKELVARHRPFETQLGPRSSTHSFPSGHAATSFACATVLAFLVPRAAPLAYVLALAIGYSRLYVGVHWPLDVLAGAALGVAIALLLLAVSRRRSWPALRRG